MIVAHTNFDSTEGMKRPVQNAPARIGENVTELLTTLSDIYEQVCLIDKNLFGEGPHGDTLRPAVDCLELGIFNSLDVARDIRGKLETIMEKL